MVLAVARLFRFLLHESEGHLLTVELPPCPDIPALAQPWGCYRRMDQPNEHNPSYRYLFIIPLVVRIFHVIMPCYIKPEG